MIPARTERMPLVARAATEQVVADVRELFRRALHDTGVSAAHVAALIGRAPSWVEHWYASAHAPLYLLAHPRVPLQLVLRLIADVLSVRAADARSGRTVETSTALLIEIAGRVLALAGRALADGRVDALEQEELRTAIAELRDLCERWTRDHGGTRASHR